jgi:4-aminobutyrate aminotransferase-like enzyme/Ser/Thr protein kinase RdoA (MazF antagonist)
VTTADVLRATPPRLSVADAERISRDMFAVRGTARPLVSERDQNFLIAADDGTRWVLKVSNAAEPAGVIEMEVAAVAHVASVDPTLPVPRARTTVDGTVVGQTTVGGTRHLVRMIPFLPGRHVDPTELGAPDVRQLGQVVARVGLALRAFFHADAGRVIHWDQRHLPELFPNLGLVEPAGRRAKLERVIDRFTARVVPALATLRAQVIHNDLTLDNLLLGDRNEVTGIIDFGDMAHTALVLDIPATLQSLLRGRDDVLELSAAFLGGYAETVPIEPAEADLLADLLAGRMAQTILISAERVARYPDNAYIRGWSEPAWALLDQLDAIGMDHAAARLAASARRPRPTGGSGGWIGDTALLERRRVVLGSALEPLSYATPLHLVRGEGVWMEDARGRRYLDAYNNVPVVGHAHPRVTEAIARQAATLNTNTRYLHEHVVELAERITASLPESLDTVMFVNSGSEANDLAWRLATTVTGGDTGIVTDWAYHGVTAAIADFSPSEWPRGVQPEGVETFPAPNTYRGPYADAADARTAADGAMTGTLARLRERRRRPAAIFIDATFTADGIFHPAPAVVAGLVDRARAAGALYIADEVQSGYGRTGDGLWGFTAWPVTPDIVTLGKPMGNGHPIAAVVTRAELVDRFAQVTTFFSTFGGNPVACAAGLAVLDVIEDEGLVANAEAVGIELRKAIAALATRHPAIGDVRGRGLMIGVELVADRASREPAPNLAANVKERMRERGVLVGTTGRLGTTLKIRPPLSITAAEAALIVEALDDSLGADSG